MKLVLQTALCVKMDFIWMEVMFVKLVIQHVMDVKLIPLHAYSVQMDIIMQQILSLLVPCVQIIVRSATQLQNAKLASMVITKKVIKLVVNVIFRVRHVMMTQMLALLLVLMVIILKILLA